jgi:hypothetical protein
LEELYHNLSYLLGVAVNKATSTPSYNFGDHSNPCGDGWGFRCDSFYEKEDWENHVRVNSCVTGGRIFSGPD